MRPVPIESLVTVHSADEADGLGLRWGHGDLYQGAEISTSSRYLFPGFVFIGALRSGVLEAAHNARFCAELT